MFDLPHVAARVYGTPLLIAQPKLDTILAAVGPRLIGGETMAEVERPEPGASRYATNETRMGTPVTMEGIAVVPVLGTLIRRGSWLDSLSGLTSYAWVEDQVRAAMADPQVRGVMLEIDSHGGEAGGCFDLADTIRTLRQEFGKPIWAMANESALSAGYAIACTGDQVWLSRTAEVGSVGVVCAHVDQSTKDAKDGLAWTYIHAGAHKVDGNPHAPLDKDVLARIQADVDGLYSMFVDHVAGARGLSADVVRATEAAIYRGSDAIKARLADKLGTMSEALDAMAARLPSQEG